MTARTTTVPPAPRRLADSHKGTFGTVVVIGGSPAMIGAPALVATAALRTGCGLARIMTHPAILPHCLTIEPSATGLPMPLLEKPEELERTLDGFGSKEVLAVGSGLGVGEAARQAVALILDRERPTVLDADGLNNLADLGERGRADHGALVLTPHPGEYGRLAEAAGIDADPTDPAQRPDAAAALADRYHAVVVLKGHRTIVSDGRRHYQNTTGNPALATAGSGDILGGAVAALLAQGMDRFDAAVLGVYLHGLAADLWSQRHHGASAGMLARDLGNWLAHALAEHQGNA